MAADKKQNPLKIPQIDHFPVFSDIILSQPILASVGNKIPVNRPQTAGTLTYDWVSIKKGNDLGHSLRNAM